MRTRAMVLALALLAGLLLFPIGASAQDSAEICDAEGLVAAVEGGDEEGTLEGMADDPVGTAASNNPVLTSLVEAVSAAGLVDTLNSAEALTVFAPTDCAFASLDPATLEAAMADPTGLLTTVLGFHVIAGEQIASADLDGEYETFTGETLTVTGGDTITLNDGQATVLVPDIQTANATVHLIDAVMIPPSVSEAAAAEGATEAGTEGATEQATEAATEGATEEAMAEATEEPAEGEASEEPTEETAEATEEPADGEVTAEPTEEAATEAPADGDSSEAPTGGVATGAGGTAGGSSLPLVAIGILAVIAAAGAVVWRRA